MTIEEIQQEIIEEFSMYEDWMDKYGYLIELGNDLEDLDPKDKNDQNIIKGCQSRVWLVADIVDGKINFEDERNVRNAVRSILDKYQFFADGFLTENLEMVN